MAWPAPEPLPGFEVIPGVSSDDTSRLLQAVAPNVAPTSLKMPQRPAMSAAPPPAMSLRPTSAAPSMVNDMIMPGAPPRPHLPEPPQPHYRDPLMAVDVLNPMMAIAMLGSLFARQPAVAAGNAAAAAMTAQRQNDRETYQDKLSEYRENLMKAHTENQADVAAYKVDFENKKLALTERLANMRGRAVRRGDHVMLSQLDAGADPWTVIQQREKAGEIIKPALEKAAFVKSFMAKPENENATVQDANKAYAEYKEGGKVGKPLTTAQQQAKAIEESMQSHAGDPNWSRAKSIAEVKAASTPPKQGSGMTGNQRVKEQHLADAITEQLDKIDGVIQTLQKYRMAAGAGGYAMRGKEIIGNLSGTDLGTDREQFRRDLEFLKLMFPRLMAQGGRPLSAESKRVDAIIGGLSMGDTTANTERSLEELRKIYMRRLDEQRDILGTPGGAPNNPTQPPGATPPSGPPSGGGVDWDSYGKAQ